MKWRILLSVAIAVFLTTGRAASAESVSLATGSSTSLSYGVTEGVIDIYLPQVTVPGAIFLELNGLMARANYVVRTHLTNASGQAWNTVEAEVLNKAGVGDDSRDRGPRAGWAPAGYSHSNGIDGFSFAENANLPRWSDAFADVFADESRGIRDYLRFSDGSVLAGGTAMLTFGVRDYDGSRPFLLALGVNGFDAAATPEPATLLLIGTGLAGLTRAAQRRRRT